MKRSCLIFTLLLFSILSQGQGTRKTFNLEIGKPMPSFTLNEVGNFPKRKISLDEFKGKWLILDWWTQFCNVCIESFPKVNELQKKYGDQVQFVFIGYTGTLKVLGSATTGNKAVHNIYNKAITAFDMKVPIAYDSLLYQQFGLGTTPYIVIIDPRGIIKGITYHLKASDVDDFLAGRQTNLPKAYKRGEKTLDSQYDLNLPYLTYGNGGEDTAFKFRSLLSDWNPKNQTSLTKARIYHPSSKGRFDVLGENLYSLYKFAYIGQNFLHDNNDSLYGRVSPFVILDIKDSSLFKSDTYSGRGMYCYSLSVPSKKAGREFMMEVMQRDLQNYFGFVGAVEERSMPYWSLIATKDGKEQLKTKGDSPFFQAKDNGKSGFSFKNRPVKIIINFLANYFQNGPPFIDETGIIGNIDISIDAILTDFEDFKRALNEKGLDIVAREKNMKVLVIKDSPSGEMKNLSQVGDQ